MSNSITQLYNTTPEQLKAELLDGVRECLVQFSKNSKEQETSEWLTRKELKVMLSVSLVTIHDWCNKGILKPYKIGRQTRFKKKEVLEVLESSRT